MKVRKVSDEEYFRPVVIEITFETKEELTAFFMVFNHSDLTEAMRSVAPSFNAKGIRNELGNVKYGEYWERFCSKIKGTP